MSSSSSVQLRGKIVDLHQRRTYPGVVEISGGRIASVLEDRSVSEQRYIMPGFIDAHVHIESSLLVPSEFARMAVVHGTVGTVSDPHEIANVCGMDGVRFMLENGERVPFVFSFGAPSCVPATTFETAGAEITVEDIRELFKDDRIRYLSEMMNWPGVLFDDPMVLAKIKAAHDAGRPVDGHAPGLRGDDAARYAAHGITTDHECFTLDEALDKIAVGMKILIREGSAARNYDALHSLLGSHPEHVMYCCDDAHPDMLAVGHIDRHVKRSLALGYDLYDVLRAASVHPVEHYRLPIGLLREGDPADFIVVSDLDTFSIEETWIKGACVARKGQVLFDRVSVDPINQFVREPIGVADIAIEPIDAAIRIIGAHDGQLVTSEEHGRIGDADVLKIVVVNRYGATPPAVAYIKGIGLQRGAIASSVAHDSHNIVAVGVTDEEIVSAINAVIAHRGGLSAVDSGDVSILPLPVAGLMSDRPCEEVTATYIEIDATAKALDSPLRAPFMTLSFMALLVIPDLKLSDKGLFSGRTFNFVPLTD